MKIGELLSFFAILVLCVVMTILPSYVAFAQDTTVTPELIGQYQVDGRVFKAIQVTYEVFRTHLNKIKKSQNGATATWPSDITEYEIRVWVDEDNFNIDYRPYKIVFGGGAHYVVSKKTFKLIDTKYTK